MKHEYDFLVVGAGLFGATFACMAKQHGKKCLVIDKRSHLGGNVYCEDAEGITVHKYGPHIFHTHDEKVWNCNICFDMCSGNSKMKTKA